jgi:hypothetical protein
MCPNVELRARGDRFAMGCFDVQGRLGAIARSRRVAFFCRLDQQFAVIQANQRRLDNLKIGFASWRNLPMGELYNPWLP